jgi:uncharacterized membrane protein
MKREVFGMMLEKLLQFYYSHRGGINGALIGIVAAVSILLFGLFKVIFVAIFAALGYYLGKKIHEDKDYIKNLLDRVLPPGTYR